MENLVLILEPDPAIAAHLEKTLKLHGRYQPHKAESLRAACHMLAERRYGLAIIPAVEANHRAHSMRALQPDLPIVLTLSKKDDSQSVDLRQYQGHLSLDNLEEEMPAILIQARWEKDQRIHNSSNSWRGDDTFSRKGLKDLCRLIQLDGSVQQVILSKGLDFVAGGWVEDDKRAVDVVKRVNETWDGGVRSSQLQYYQIGDEDTVSLLYTRLIGGYLLTLVTSHDVSLPVIRSQSDRLTAEITRKSIDERSTDQMEHRVPSSVTIDGDKARISYALVIWPIEPLPRSLQRLVTKTIEQIARETNSDLKNLMVQEDRLQILVELPADRPSSWFAKKVKDGVKRKVQNKFGVSIELWASGFYASQADSPLSDTELSLLSRSR
jgi:hypothetical protein